MVKKDRRLDIRVSLEDHMMLTEIAEDYGVSASDVVRMLVRKEHRRLIKIYERVERTERLLNYGRRN
jgi:DNA-binding transcriptional regulator LsrR (DeoR family)